MPERGSTSSGPRRRVGRSAVPLLALALGSWFGLGRPSEAAPVRDAMVARAREVLAPKPVPCTEERAALAKIAPPPDPSTAFPNAVNPDALPDPALPFARMNPTANVGRAWLLAQGPDYAAAKSGRRLVTLTFDDGPFPETTPLVLKTLEHYQVHASFFLIGRYLDGTDARGVASRAVAKQIVEAGHLVGNHTHDHELLTTAARTDAMEQILDGERSIERAIGSRPVLFRPPYGQLDPFTEQVLAARGAEVIMWGIEAQDMQEVDADRLAESLERQIEFAEGGVVLLHDIRWATVSALPKLLTWLRMRRWDPARPDRVGYDVVDLATYMKETAAHPQPYASRAEVEHARAKEQHARHGRKVPSLPLDEGLGHTPAS